MAVECEEEVGEAEFSEYLLKRWLDFFIVPPIQFELF